MQAEVHPGGDSRLARYLETNLTGTFPGAKHQLTAMIASRGVSIARSWDGSAGLRHPRYLLRHTALRP
ncbi:MAG: hypothetical protein ACFCUT_14120 [Kiloniellaceae bacterium]